MNLDNITAHIRLRSPWEAVDLGFAMVQHNARWIFPAWSLFLIMVASTVWLLMPDNYKAYTPLIVWWFKPLYDRVLLHILSHQMFDQRLTTAEVFSAIPRLLIRTGLFSALSWRRFSLSRGFNLAIWQLEGLRGKPRRKRQSLLHQQAHSRAVWLLFGCVHLEYVIILSLYTLIIALDPTSGTWDFISNSFLDSFDPDLAYWGSLVYLLLYTLSILLIEPLYLAASFTLYLNRRTQLEAWDIELTFRKLGERLQKLAQHPMLLALLCSGLWLSFSSPTVEANTSQTQESLATERLPVSQAAEQMDAVMQMEELAEQQTVKRWLPKESMEMEDPDAEGMFSTHWLEGVANVVRGLLWLFVVIGLILAFVYRKDLAALLRPLPQTENKPPPPDVLFGMDIRPESLPDDIATQCEHLWQTGQHREALSLLYRGALMHLTRHDELPIQDSHTEGDILQLAQTQLPPVRMQWLLAATQYWREIAYAHRIPADQAIMDLLHNWSQFHPDEDAPE